MSLLDEIAFHRLLPKYERRFGDAPPLQAATLEEALETLRRGLAEADEPEPTPAPRRRH